MDFHFGRIIYYATILQCCILIRIVGCLATFFINRIITFVHSFSQRSIVKRGMNGELGMEIVAVNSIFRPKVNDFIVLSGRIHKHRDIVKSALEFWNTSL